MSTTPRPDMLRPADGKQRVQRGGRGTEALFVRNFSGFDYVVAPSELCPPCSATNFDDHRADERSQGGPCAHLRAVEFLHDILKVDAFPWANSRIESPATTVAARCAGSSMRGLRAA